MRAVMSAATQVCARPVVLLLLLGGRQSCCTAVAPNDRRMPVHFYLGPAQKKTDVTAPFAQEISLGGPLFWCV